MQSAPVAPNNINITPCKQGIKRNFHPLNNCAGLKRNIWKLLERGHEGESNPNWIKKNVNYSSEQTVAVGQAGKKEKEGIE